MTFEETIEQVTVNSIRYQKYFGLIGGISLALAFALVLFVMPICLIANIALNLLVHFVVLCFFCFGFCILMSMRLYTKTSEVTVLRPGVQSEVGKMFLSFFVWVTLLAILCTGIGIAAMVWLGHIVWLCYTIYIVALGTSSIIVGAYWLTVTFYVLFEVRRRWIAKYPEVVEE